MRDGGCSVGAAGCFEFGARLSRRPGAWRLLCRCLRLLRGRRRYHGRAGTRLSNRPHGDVRSRCRSPDAARGVCSRVPSGLRTTHVSPTRLRRWRPSCNRMWWRWHSRARLSALVGPPSAQCFTWWASQREGGVSQPGHTQPPSRAMRTQRNASLTRRVRRPTSMTRPLPLSTVGMISASQARRLTVAALRLCPLSVMPARWSPSRRASRLVLTRSTGTTRLPSLS